VERSDRVAALNANARSRLKAEPKYVAQAAAGVGFAEVVGHLLQGQLIS
jgi:hypothetical protein